MSASLVGSEMCIRDRSCVVEYRSSLWLLPPRPPDWRLRRARGTSRGSEAVSYTHLTLPTICSV
eukprot:12184240-Alexandrium_andersonii.AAC.1